MPYFITEKVFLMPSFDISEKEKQKLDTFLEILERSNASKIIEQEITRDINVGRKSYNPYRLFASIIYGFSKHSGSVRSLEESLEFDLRFIYLMEQERPSYVTISKFLNNVVVPHQKELFSSIVSSIIKYFDICIDDVFLDGTKFEANANKYKFVWKPTTFHEKLNANIKNLLVKYFDIPTSKKTFVSKEIGEYITLLLGKAKEQGINIDNLKTGKGHKKVEIVSDIRTLNNYLNRSLEYEEKEEICGDRNSFYKTDKDATAMCLKEDYYSGLGSNMHAGYNIQIIVSKGIILDYYVGQERNDFYEFIPAIDSFYKNYGFYPTRLCADSGYGSLLNYRYLKEHNIENYVKYNMWRQDVSGENIDYYKFVNGNLICINGKTAIEKSECYGRHPKAKNNRFYIIENCRRCKYKQVCFRPIKNKKSTYRVFETNEEMYLYKEEARQNLLSVKGIEMRVNRSSQVEGAFGVIKQDMNYERIRRRGLEKVSAEIMLVCLGYVIRKIFGLIDGTGSIEYWKAPEGLEPEKIPSINIEKILNKKPRKGKNETLRKSYKRANE